MPNNRNALIIIRDPNRAKADSSFVADEATSSEQAEESLPGQIRGSLPDALAMFSQRETEQLVSAIRISLAYLPQHHQSTASSLFRNMRQLISSREDSGIWRVNLGAAVDSFEIQLEQSEQLKAHRQQGPIYNDACSEPESQAYRQNFRRVISIEEDREVDLLLQSGGDIKSAVRRFIFEFDNGLLDPNGVFLWLLPLIEQLDNEQRCECIDLLREKWPTLSGPVLFQQRDVKAISELIEDWVSHAPLRELTLNIILRISLYTSYKVERPVTLLLRNMLRIEDDDDQAASYLGLLPYLPSSMAEGSVDDLRNPEIVGKEVACFASMMLELAQALSADALSDMVEAALGHYSEWWVVETLTVICRRITRQIEFSALRRASLYIINLDLRARLLGRLATRAVDVGMLALGVEIAESIELHAAKWEELRQLCLRMASAGELTMALQVVQGIPFPQERDRAYAEIALEMAAQGLISRAREIVDAKIADKVWRNWTNHLLTVAPESGSSFDLEHVQARKFSRALSAEAKDRHLLIAEAVTSLQQTRLSHEGLTKIQDALTRKNDAEFETAILDLWTSAKNDGSDFLEAVLADGRPMALKRIARLSCLLPMVDRELFALEIFSAIRRVVAWWP